jgi:hypothetical protein
LDGYAPAVDMGLMNSEPVAMYGIHNSPRIVAQRGVFTIFGKNTKPMEQIFMDHGFSQECLKKLVLPSDKIANLLRSVVSIGYTDSVVFPDLDGLAREIRRAFNFEV